MRRLCFALIALVSSITAQELSFKVQFGQISPVDYGMYTMVNDLPVFCPCGNTPAIVVFFYGSPSYYCMNHIQEMTMAMGIACSLSMLAIPCAHDAKPVLEENALEDFKELGEDAPTFVPFD